MRGWGKPGYERVYAKIQPEPNSGCWLWDGAVCGHGYGYVQFNGKTHRAHRVVFELERCPIPPGLHLDHLCRNRACVNPDHLEPVTNRENLLRGARAVNRNGVCGKCGERMTGSRLRPDNRYHEGIYRFCVPCTSAYQRAWKRSRKAKSA